MDEQRRAMIDKLRADFVLVADFRLASGDWTKDDERAFGAAIKASIDSGSPETLCMWALRFSDLAHVVTTCAMAVRIAEGRMRADIQRDKDERAAAERKRREGSRG